MMMLEVLLTVGLACAPEYMQPRRAQPTSQQCPYDEACYPIDPNPPKERVPENCWLDEEGQLTCNVADPSGKW